MGKDMTTGNPIKLIFYFALPMFFGNIFQQFYNMADTFIVSQTIGIDALAAVGSTGSINFLIIGLAIGITAGLSVITAQRFGRKDFEGLRRSLGTSLIIVVIVSVILTYFATKNTRTILELMQTPPEIIDYAYDYLSIIFGGIGITVFFNFLSNILRAIGDSRTPLIFLIIASILNVILDYTFILVFNMGVSGVGYATIIAQFIATILCLIYIKRRVPILRIYKEDWTKDWSEYKEHLRVGLPYGFQYSIIAVGTIAVQITLNRLGAVSVAAYTSANKIDQLLTMPLQTIGVAISTYVAQNFGARKYARIKEGVTKTLKITILYGFTIGLILWFFGQTLTLIFVDGNNEAVLSLAQQYFRIQAPFYPFLSIIFVLRLSLQGLGNSFAPTLAGAMELVARIFGAIILSNVFGFAGAIMSNPLAWISAVVILVPTYYATEKLIVNEPTPLAKKLAFGSKNVIKNVQLEECHTCH